MNKKITIFFTLILLNITTIIIANPTIFKIEKKNDFQYLLYSNKTFPVKLTLNTKISAFKLIKKNPFTVVSFQANDRKWAVTYLWDIGKNQFRFISTSMKSGKYYVGGKVSDSFLKFSENLFSYVDKWDGNYSFSQSEKHLNPEHPAMSWYYGLEIKKRKNCYNASYSADGFQTYERIKEILVVVGIDRIDLIAKKKLDRYYLSKGDRLFSLIIRNGKVITDWGELSIHMECDPCFEK